MKIIEQIKNHIKKIPAGEPFTTASLRHLGAADTVRKYLGRLVLAGEIKRLSRGVFAKPKKVAGLGNALPSPQKVIETIANQSSEILAIHGAEAARKLRLTTQVPMQLVLYTTGKTRKIKVYNRTVSLQHISPRKLVAPGTIINYVISALWYLGKQNVITETLNNIEKRIGNEAFANVLKHIENMPAWMANIFYKHQQSKEKVAHG